MEKIIISIILLPFVLIACKHDHGTHHDHDHDHDDVKLLITGYSDEFEVFAESDPFVQGKTSDILVHFTHLENFKPLTEGVVTMSLVIGNQGIRATSESPSKPGIYRFQLQPETTGRCNIFFEINHDGKTHRVDGGTFRVYADEHSAIHAAEDLLIEHPTAITFTKEQSWMVNFATSIAERKSLGMVIRTVGEILPAQEDEFTISAQTHGIVRMINNALYDGNELQSGQILLNISGEGLAEGNATQRYQEARNNFERARADYERLTRLADEQIISQRELLQAKNEFDNAKAVFDNLSRNFSESGQQVRSPVNGFLTNLYVSAGQYVEAGQPIATISRNRDLVIKTEIQQRYAPYLPDLITANVVGREGQTYSLAELNGQILSRARNVNKYSHLLPVYLQVESRHDFVTGTLVDVYLKTSDPHAHLVVPNDALIEEQGNYFVFVQLHPESFEKREIKKGITDGLYTQVVKGLEENERIVSRGALLVKMAAASAAIDPHSGHVH